MSCNHPVDQLMPSADYPGMLYCRGCEKRFKEKNGWYFEWKPKEKGECVVCFSENKRWCNVDCGCYCHKKANQGGCEWEDCPDGPTCQNVQQCKTHGHIRCKPQKPSEEEREFKRAVFELLSELSWVSKDRHLGRSIEFDEHLLAAKQKFL